MDPRAQSIINHVAYLAQQFGAQVTVNRVVQAATPVMNVFATPANATTQTFTASVIIESQKLNTLPTLIGMKPKEELRIIANPGAILANDEIVWGGHTYKVEFVQPQPFAGADVVDFVHAYREVT